MVNSLMKEQTEKLDRRIHQICVIVDLQNAGRAQMSNIVRKYLEVLLLTRKKSSCAFFVSAHDLMVTDCHSIVACACFLYIFTC